MSAITEFIDHVREVAERWFGHEDAAVKADAQSLIERADEVKAAVEKEAPALAHDAEADAADVVHTAETEGVAPAAAEAAKDAETLGEEAVHDAEAALAPASKSETPAEPTTPSTSA